MDVPDTLYQELKIRAASEKTTVKELLVRGAKATLAAKQPKKVRRPVQQVIKNRSQGVG